MKKEKIQKDYPIEDVSMEDIKRLLNKNWEIECQKSGEIKLTRTNKAGMLSVKFVRVVE